jgi:stearoyl-CoA desaturase (delta-9 desaturase)
VSALSGFNIFTAQPSVQFRRNEWFYFQYDGLYMAAFLALDAWLLTTGTGPLIEWQWWYLAFLPLVIYVHILLNVFVHNCCHGNFPRSINRIVGELAGVLVITRYASWEIIHQRHHRYSDDPEKDPHHVLPNFWWFLARTMLINVELQLQNQAYDQFGDTPRNRLREKVRSVFSFSVMLPLIFAAYLLLGWEAFFFLYVPAQAVGWVHVAHFNWATHNAHSATGDYKPVNLDSGWYRFGNKIWFGLYMHANHHKRANIFNPAKMDEVLARRQARAWAEN